jgi:hypothetical protein
VTWHLRASFSAARTRMVLRPGARATAAIIALAAGFSGWQAASGAPVAGRATGPAAAALAGWTPVFSDRFTGPAGSRAGRRWTYDRGTGYHGARCPANWGTGEVETDTAATGNVRLDGHGHLQIRPLRSRRGWTSGRIETVSAKFAAPAGGQLRVTAVIRQPSPRHGLGYWPAFWMLGARFRAAGAGTSGKMACSRWPSAGEIDVLEDVNARSQLAGTLHCGVAPGGPCHEFTGRGSGLRRCHGCQAGYHRYAVVIDRTRAGHESITWYLDGRRYFTVTEGQVGTATWKTAVDHGFFLILDLAIGGSFPDAICGCTTPARSTSPGAAMSIDSVTVETRTQ